MSEITDIPDKLVDNNLIIDNYGPRICDGDYYWYNYREEKWEMAEKKDPWARTGFENTTDIAYAYVIFEDAQCERIKGLVDRVTGYFYPLDPEYGGKGRFIEFKGTGYYYPLDPEYGEKEWFIEFKGKDAWERAKRRELVCAKIHSKKPLFGTKYHIYGLFCDELEVIPIPRQRADSIDLRNAFLSEGVVPKTVAEKIHEETEDFKALILGTAKKEPISSIYDPDIQINRGTSKNFTKEQLEDLRKLIKKYMNQRETGRIDFMNYFYRHIPEIKNVIIARPYTTVLWMDGTKTQVKCMDTDHFDPEHGFAMAVLKKIYEEPKKPNAYSKWVKKWVKIGLDNGEKQRKKKAKKTFKADSCDSTHKNFYLHYDSDGYIR